MGLQTAGRDRVIFKSSAEVDGAGKSQKGLLRAAATVTLVSITFRPGESRKPHAATAPPGLFGNIYHCQTCSLSPS